MVTHLLESGTRRRRSVAGTIPSIAFHSVLILAAINATAHAALRAPDKPHVVSLPLVAPAAPAPPIEHRLAPSAPSPDRNRFNTRAIPDPVLQSFPDHTFRFDPDGIVAPAVHEREFGDGVSGRNGVTDSSSNSVGVLSSDQVDRQAAPLPGTLAPRYPEALRAEGLEGTVVARFVVDSTGRVEAGSFTIVGAANPLFTSAVEAALGRARFRAAEAYGVRVRQLVEQSFTFTLH